MKKFLLELLKQAALTVIVGAVTKVLTGSSKPTDTTPETTPAKS